MAQRHRRIKKFIGWRRLAIMGVLDTSLATDVQQLVSIKVWTIIHFLVWTWVHFYCLGLVLIVLRNHLISIIHHLMLCLHVASVTHWIVAVMWDVLVVGRGHLWCETYFGNRSDLLEFFVLLKGFKDWLFFFRITLGNNVNIIILILYRLQIFDHVVLTILLLL